MFDNDENLKSRDAHVALYVCIFPFATVKKEMHVSRIDNKIRRSTEFELRYPRIMRAVLQGGYQRETRLHLVLMQRRAVLFTTGPHKVSAVLCLYTSDV